MCSINGKSAAVIYSKNIVLSMFQMMGIRKERMWLLPSYLQKSEQLRSRWIISHTPWNVHSPPWRHCSALESNFSVKGQIVRI